MSVFTDNHTLSLGFSGVSNAGGCAAVTLRGEGLSGRLIETRLLPTKTQRFIEFLREQLQDA
ncbi:hypothetical protein [Pseudomonas fluorescens]|uniref:hypothetical protein n=1 Tax=Pseudomonas fluorescens TaxID=294 RepID=UPI003D22A668